VQTEVDDLGVHLDLRHRLNTIFDTSLAQEFVLGTAEAEGYQDEKRTHALSAVPLGS
jgi:hypothetical protein